VCRAHHNFACEIMGPVASAADDPLVEGNEDEGSDHVYNEPDTALKVDGFIHGCNLSQDKCLLCQ
jgi:hypothetical protein